jgi:hypothetical protein
MEIEVGFWKKWPMAIVENIKRQAQSGTAAEKQVKGH